MINKEIENLLHKNNGKLPEHPENGNYKLLYMTSNFEIVCCECANELIHDDEVILENCLIHWVGEYLVCQKCCMCLFSEEELKERKKKR